MQLSLFSSSLRRVVPSPLDLLSISSSILFTLLFLLDFDFLFLPYILITHSLQIISLPVLIIIFSYFLKTASLLAAPELTTSSIAS
jgi:hypothetical protein